MTTKFSDVFLRGGTKLIDEIAVGDRIGQLREITVTVLMASIRLVGLINPIIVTEASKLVAGLHRLEACKRLGWTEIPVATIPDNDDAIQIAVAVEENRARNDRYTILEEGETAIALEGVVTELGTRSIVGRPRNGESDSQFVSTDALAGELGLTRRVYQKRKQVVASLTEPVRKKLRGTPLANRLADLQEIGELTAEEQIEVVAQVVATGAKRLSDVLPLALADEGEASSSESGADASPTSDDTVSALQQGLQTLNNPGDVLGLLIKATKGITLTLQRLGELGYADLATTEFPTTLKAMLQEVADLGVTVPRVGHRAGTLFGISLEKEESDDSNDITELEELISGRKVCIHRAASAERAISAFAARTATATPTPLVTAVPLAQIKAEWGITGSLEDYEKLPRDQRLPTLEEYLEEQASDDDVDPDDGGGSGGNGTPPPSSEPEGNAKGGGGQGGGSVDGEPDPEIMAMVADLDETPLVDPPVVAKTEVNPRSREENDCYYTPEPLASHLVSLLDKPAAGPVWVPTSGPGAFVKAVRGRWPDAHVEATELDSWKLLDSLEAGAHRVDTGVDARNWSSDLRPSLVVDNPPFDVAVDIVSNALDQVRDDGQVGMLLPVNILAKPNWRGIWKRQDLDCRVLVISPTPMFLTKDDRERACGYMGFFFWNRGTGQMTIAPTLWRESGRAGGGGQGKPLLLSHSDAERLVKLAGSIRGDTIHIASPQQVLHDAVRQLGCEADVHPRRDAYSLALAAPAVQNVKKTLEDSFGVIRPGRRVLMLLPFHAMAASSRLHFWADHPANKITMLPGHTWDRRVHGRYTFGLFEWVKGTDAVLPMPLDMSLVVGRARPGRPGRPGPGLDTGGEPHDAAVPSTHALLETGASGAGQSKTTQKRCTQMGSNPGRSSFSPTA